MVDLWFNNPFNWCGDISLGTVVSCIKFHDNPSNNFLNYCSLDQSAGQWTGWQCHQWSHAANTNMVRWLSHVLWIRLWTDCSYIQSPNKTELIWSGHIFSDLCPGFHLVLELITIFPSLPLLGSTENLWSAYHIWSSGTGNLIIPMLTWKVGEAACVF